MSQSNTYKIYTLSAPDQEQVRYIGMTCQSINKRLNHHVNVSYPCHKTNWIKSLKLNGLLPVINIIDEGLMHDEAAYMEQQYIKLFKASGAKLTNMTKGGTGTPGHKVTDEAKQKLKERWTGYKHTDEAKKKMSDHQKIHGNAYTGKTHSAEIRKKISIAATGKNLGDSNPSKREEVRAKISAFHKGKILSDSTKDKIRQGHLGKPLSQKHKDKLAAKHHLMLAKVYRSIIQCDINGNEIKRWNSMSAMTRETGIPSNNISAACRGKLKTAYGFTWKYVDDKNNS